MFNTIRAEAQSHARTGGFPADNPYPKGTSYHEVWDQGFMDGLLIMRRHYAETLKDYNKLLDDHHKVEKEYQSFVTEMGY
jgi:hypothetical protein